MEKISVDKAISKGLSKVVLPSIALMVGFIGTALYIDANYAVGSIFPLYGFISGFTFAWLWWSYSVVKWKVWAYPIVDDLYSLKLEAMRVGIIWSDGNLFNKTEIWSKKDRKIVKKAEDEYYP